jgi:phosphopentomutase
MLEEAESFGTLGATIADIFGVAMPEGTIGNSYLGKLL